MNFARLFVVLLIAACAPEPGPPLVISELDITRPMPGRSMSAGYLLLENRSDQPIDVTRIESPEFGRVEMHETVIEDGIARMRRMTVLEVPANGSVRLERGGRHLMLMQPAADIDRVRLDLYSGDSLVLTAVTQLADR